MRLNFTYMYKKKLSCRSIKRCFFTTSGERVNHSVALGCLFIHYLRKYLYHWEKTHASVTTLLMANIVWEILIPQICVDSDDLESPRCTSKLQLNLLLMSNNNKYYHSFSGPNVCLARLQRELCRAANIFAAR